MLPWNSSDYPYLGAVIVLGCMYMVTRKSKSLIDHTLSKYYSIFVNYCCIVLCTLGHEVHFFTYFWFGLNVTSLMLQSGLIDLIIVLEMK